MQGSTLIAQREKEISSLRYGDKMLTMPDQAQLEALTAAELESQWQHLTGAPATFFIFTDLPENVVKDSVIHYLAGIPRTHALSVQSYYPRRGHREHVSHQNQEPKADVRLWTFRDEA